MIRFTDSREPPSVSVAICYLFPLSAPTLSTRSHGRFDEAREAGAHDLNMLKFLKRWLGWDSDSGPFDFGDLRVGGGRSAPMPRVPPRPPSPRVDAQQRAPAPPASPSQGQAAAKTGAPPKKAKKERAPADVLDNPRLTLDRPNTDGFDPYNTGAFNRSTSWERIGRHKR